MSSINTHSVSVLAYQSGLAEVSKDDKLHADTVKQPAAAIAENVVENETSREPLEKAVEVIQNALALQQRSLSFSIDDVSGRSVIRVTDYDTNELIKQIPSEELLKVAQDVKRLQDEMGQSIGLLVNNKV